MTKKRINVALQGGGAHGAFTWGALDRLLEDDQIEIAGISGTSAGALNGAAVKSGLALGGPVDGRQIARDKLSWLWGQIGAIDNADFLRLLELWSPPTAAVSHILETSPQFFAADFLSRFASPYALGPFYRNPLKEVVEKLFCDTLCTDEGPVYSICATNVRTGKIKIFDHSEITPDAIMASACLPTLFQAVEIDDPATGKREAYWDGGYTGNPALFPLFSRKLPDDVVIININPLHREQLPTTPQQIQNRINEISFNSSMFRELRAISFVKHLIREGTISNNSMKNVLVHMISDDVLMNDLSVATKMVPTPKVLQDLKEAGRNAAQSFIETDLEKVGVEDTVDLEAMFA